MENEKNANDVQNVTVQGIKVMKSMNFTARPKI